MRVYGVDFTSSPTRAKPITAAECSFEGGRLRVSRLLRVCDLAAFERALATPGPWVAGFDFPFGQPRRLGRALDWPAAWEEYVAAVARRGRTDLEQVLALYKEARPAGDKEHRRATDRAARALSPMKLYGVPLAKMFFAGAPRLLASGVSVVPCRPTADDRVALEAYPALVARRLLGPRRRYKADARREQTDAKRKARRELVAALRSPRLAETYGLSLDLDRFRAHDLVDDARGDLLDAVLAAVQAAWAWERRERGWGVPAACDPWEGWIVDPATAAPPREGRTSRR